MITAKRVYDMFWSVIGLLVFAPLFAVIAVLIKLDDGGPVFFHQERVGYKGKPLIIRKFRTMVKNAEKRGVQLTVSGDSCITRVGYWLRKTKLDELPQLMNVLLGEMSLVGPRPEVPRYVALYTNEQRRVFELVPGITDPASIKYHNEGEILASSPDPELLYIKEILPEKIRIALSYAERATVLSDTWVIMNTVLNIVFRSYQESSRENSGA